MSSGRAGDHHPQRPGGWGGPVPPDGREQDQQVEDLASEVPSGVLFTPTIASRSATPTAKFGSGHHNTEYVLYELLKLAYLF